MEGKRVSIKLLLPNGLTGSLIGTGGKAIRDLMTETKAKILVSGATEHYPGTNDRVVLLSGPSDAVSLAQTLIWEMIALNVSAPSGEERSVVWDPSAMMSSLGNNDDVEVSCKISIPASAGGMILGRAGASIRQISEESDGVRISMSGKEEALFTQERIITINGATGGCIKATDKIINKFCEEEGHMFVFRGTSYSAPQQGVGMMGAAPFYGANQFGVFNPAMAAAGGVRGGKPRGAGRGGATIASTVIEPEQIIQLAVPDEIVGNLFGRGGSTLREIISLSGAKVAISNKGDFVEGTTNRLVTITGTPICAQTAHMFVNQRLQTPSKPAPARRLGGTGGRSDDMEDTA